jgi:broad specificity phosphatase PhoE
VLLVRHAETEWSLAGRHTGRTDLPLTEAGRERARGLAGKLAGRRFQLVLVSPLRRARETCELSSLGAHAHAREELQEWDYGDYEGLTSAQIDAQRPGWSLWRDGCPGGESPAQVGARADRVVAELRELDGDAAVFSHGHLLRVLGVRWNELPVADGAHLMLSAGAISTLGYEHAVPAIARWNDAS